MKNEYDRHQLYPLPAVLVGALVDERPNYLVIGYICPFAFGRYIFLSMYRKRYTFGGIREHRAFSVNIPSEALLREMYICGSKSGRDYDKSRLFDTFYGELKTAPMITQCPINIECKVTEIITREEGEGVIGRVIKSYVDEECLTEGELDISKVHPLLWSQGAGDNLYYGLGPPLDRS
ncbi:MAG TPA: flavin reductase family protein [Acidobacteriota bacterium]|nr:flavin reductase family protein [Acidobacteriota bacterium]